jgi:phage-related protein
MPVVAYNEDAAEDVAGIGPEACPLGRLEQGGPERISEVYTVRFSKAVYVLHPFQKKSRRAIATPKGELDLIGTRLSRAKEDYEAWLKSR